MKRKRIISRIFLPSYRTLLYVLLSFFALGSLYGAIFFSLHDENLAIFTKAWLIVPILYGVYLLYGYLRLIILRTKELKGDSGFLKSIIRNKEVRSVYVKALGVAVSFFFAMQFHAKGYMTGFNFYWFLAEFYSVTAILKLYIHTIVEKGDSKLGCKCFILIYSLGLLLSAAMGGITIFVIFYDGIFEKSVYLIAAIAVFTVYKLISASVSFDKARKLNSRLELSKSYIALSSAMLSVYTFSVAMLVMVSQHIEMKRFSFIGFIATGAIFVLGRIGLIRSIKDIRSDSE